VTENDGRILVNCFAGCTVDAICNALGITTKDLRTDQGLSPRVTLSDLAQGDRQLLATLQALGCVEQDSKVGFPVTYADGTQGFTSALPLMAKANGDIRLAGRHRKPFLPCIMSVSNTPSPAAKRSSSPKAR
jgi:hypothetical protein